MDPSSQGEPDRKTVRVVIVDDHELLRDALRNLLQSDPALEVCGEASDVSSAIEIARDTQPDLMLIDVALKKGDGLEVVKRIREKQPGIRLLVLSMYESKLFAERALRAGASGYVNKQQPSEDVLAAIRTVLAGEIYLDQTMTREVLRRTTSGDDGARSPVELLSDRELEIFRLIGNGVATRQIAKELHISTSTVETYRERLKTKLNAGSGAELTRLAIQWVLENG